VKFALKANEQVLYPSPFVEDEHNPLIVSTQRLIWTGGGKKRELDAAKITYSGKGFHQKFVLAMFIFGLLGAPFFAFGAYKFYTYKDKPTEPPAQVEGMPRKPITAKDKMDYQHNRQQQILGIVLGVFGAAFLGVGYLLYRKRLTVVIGGSGKALAIPVKDKATQDKILMMLGAAQTSAKAMAPPPMPEKVQKMAGALPPKLGGLPPKLGK
jgi:hypothetical protein